VTYRFGSDKIRVESAPYIGFGAIHRRT
jgi:hypothetical protein